jgi:type II secretory ATPase GspE/PulE/Tfp pilus assembly ATPase PilB-like protein
MSLINSSEETKIQQLEKKLEFNEKLKYVTNRINSAKNIDEILLDLKKDIKGLFDVDRMTIYAIDTLKEELYSKHMTGNEVSEIRVPISPASLSGYSAYSMDTINISDVYDDMALKEINAKLSFDKSWDEKTGYRTKQVLVTPIRFENQLFGIIQLINKMDDDSFTVDDEKNVKEIARILGIAFRNQTKMVQTRFNSLISNGIISEEELKKARALAREKNKDVETILIEEFDVKKQDMGASIAQFYGCKFIEFNDRLIIPRELLKGLNTAYLKRAYWVPLAMADDKLIVVVDNPSQMKTAEIKNLIKASEYEFRVALKEDIVKFLENADRQVDDGNVSITDVLAELDITEEKSEAEMGQEGDVLDENASTIVRLVNQIIIDGYEKGASDIHVEPSKEKKITDVRFRIDGACMRHLEVPFTHSPALVSRLKIMANLDIAERRLPQDGKIRFNYKGRPIELRVATCPTVGGEDVVMRILAASEPIPLEVMGLCERDYTLFMEAIKKPYGIALVVGPTGSGKTTTLHSALGVINTPDRKIWTAEDPVEITQYGLRQVQVKPKIDFTFANAMRSFLRADPDVIMVGEMRDHETAAIGVEASLTGHLVFSTLHTNSAPETVTRLIDIGIDPFSFADALLCVLAQRLTRTLCKSCKEEYHPPREEFDELVEAYGEEMFPELGIEYNDDFKLCRAKGCEECAHTGYKGRAGLYELLVGSDPIKTLIQKKALMEDIRKQAMDDGMRSLYQDGIKKVLSGMTDIRRVQAVCIK